MYSEIVLPRRVRPQPQPHVNPGGDCGACVLGGLLNLQVTEVYDRYLEGKPKSLSWFDMRNALSQAYWTEERLDRFVEEIPMWPWEVHPPFLEWGPHAGHMSRGWYHYVRMAVDAGYYAIALVDVDKNGPFGGGSNHWVMIAGARGRREPFPDGKGAVIHEEVLVSCSSAKTPDEEWVGKGDFLNKRGGFNLLLARPPSPIKLGQRPPPEPLKLQ